MSRNQAIIISRSAAAQIEAAGMTAENQYRLGNGDGVAYGEEAFNALIDKYDLGWNSVISFLNEEQC